MVRRVMVLCATRRGYLFLAKLAELHPENEYLIVSFREEPWEPPFVADIEVLAKSIGGQFVEARTITEARLPSAWRSEGVDLMLLVNWRYKLAPNLYGRARLGAYAFHDALLPAYRGFSPTVWAIINGDDQTGVTLFRICERVDAGDIIDQERVAIGATEPIGVVLERVTAMYLTLLERNIGRLLDGSAPGRAQDEGLATYTCRRTPEDNRIDWTAPTKRIYDLIRAVSSPYPGAHTLLAGRVLRVWSAAMDENWPRLAGRIPGQIFDMRPEGVMIVTGDGMLTLNEVQFEGEARVPAPRVLRPIGHTLGR